MPLLFDDRGQPSQPWKFHPRIGRTGVEAKSAAEVLQPHVKFPLDIDTSALDPYFWAKTVAGMPSEVSSNFIPKTVQRTAVRKKAVRAASWLAVAASLCAIVVTAWVEVLLHEQSKLDPEIDRSIIELTAKRESLQQLESELGNLNARLAQLSARHPAIPAWFLSRLGEMVPDAAVLRSAELALENGQWVFEIEGATSPTLAAPAETLAQFESKLAEQPWSASVSDDWRMEWLDQLRSGQAAKTGLLGFRLIGRVF